MNSKVCLLQVDERCQSSGGTVAVLHSEATKGRIVVRLLGALLKPIVPDVLLELVILADHAKEQETEHHTEANEDNLAGVTVGSQISSFFKLYGRSICSTHMRI